MTNRQTPFLDKINTPDQLRQLPASKLPALASDLRYDMIKAISHKALLLFEESIPGGFSAHILQFMASEALLDNGLKVRIASLPDEYIDHAERSAQLVSAGLDVDSLFAVASQLVFDKIDSGQAKYFKNLGNK